ncbi:MAG: OmpA family protein, partial [Myxococcota bacterium]
LDKVYFELNSAQIKQDSFGLLDEVAATLLNHPELELLEVQGHTDQQGSATYNQGLSEKRAVSVRTYMISQGVEAERLRAKGYGEAEPLINETNAAAYAANRRVEFHILKRSAAK